MSRNPEQPSGEIITAGAIERPHVRITPEHHERHENPEEEKYDTDKARSEALKEAKEKQHYTDQEKHEKAHKQPYISPRDSMDKSFAKTMSRVRDDMPLPQRVFSKIIHAPLVEKTSDALGSTVARPDAILSGSICAFVSTTVLYFTARHYGFSLSGSETIATFAAGWLVGILFDMLRGLIRR